MKLYPSYNKTLAGFLFFFLILIAFSFAQNPAPALKSKKEVQVVNEKNYTGHTVAKKETLYSLSRQYGVTVEEILAANPEVAENGLKNGQIIKIPLKGVVKIQEVKAPSSPVLIYTKPKKNGIKDTAKAKSFFADTLKTAVRDTVKKVPVPVQNAVYTVALFLPLNLPAEITGNEEEENRQEETISSMSLMGLEFHEGFKMAVDSLQKEGLMANIQIYDIAGDTGKINQLLQKPEAKKANMIIGVASSLSGNNKLAKFSRDNSISMISPLSNADKILIDNPFVINCTPSVKMQCSQMSEFIVDSFANANIVILNGNSSKDINLGNNFKQSITSLFKAKGNITSKIKVVNHADLGVAGVKESLSSTVKNIIIIPSSEEAFISMVLFNLKPLLSNFDITVCGLPTWQKFETIDADIFQQLNTYIFNSFYVDYEAEATIRFRKKYREIYKTEPSDYVYHGFDAGYYYLKALMNFGPGFIDILPELKYNVMHTTCDFERKGLKGGFENKYISILKYENFQLKKLNITP